MSQAGLGTRASSLTRAGSPRAFLRDCSKNPVTPAHVKTPPRSVMAFSSVYVGSVVESRALVKYRARC